MIPLCTIASRYHHVMKWQSQHLFRRGIVTSTSEPPLDSVVPEKPFTLVLLEDPSLYQDSWEGTFHKTVPQHYGMSFASLSSKKTMSLSERVDSLKVDVGQIPDAVLVARGPQSSWVAQLYLESLFLRGLIMVDPILFDQPQEMIQENLNALGKASDEHWNRFMIESQERQLKLEPNSVPMLVISSQKQISAASTEVAERHSDLSGPYGDVEVVEIDASSSVDYIVESIDDWVDTIY